MTGELADFYDYLDSMNDELSEHSDEQETESEYIVQRQIVLNIVKKTWTEDDDTGHYDYETVARSINLMPDDMSSLNVSASTIVKDGAVTRSIESFGKATFTYEKRERTL